MLINIIFQIIGLLYGIYIMTLKTTKSININLFILNIINMGIYLSIHNYIAAITFGIIAIRSIVFSRKKYFKTNFICYSFCIIQIIITILGNDNNLFILLPLLSVVVASIVTWFLSPQGIRLGLAFSDGMWLIYNIYFGLYIICISNFIGVISKLVLYYKEKSKKEQLIN